MTLFDDYLATLRAATRPATTLDRGDLMDAIAEAVDDTQWRDHQLRD